MKAPIRQAWHPAPYDEPDVMALKALQTGTANEGQQKRALRYIIESLAGTYDETFFPDERASNYAQGKRHVGLQIVKMLNLSSSVFSEPPLPKTKRK